MPAQNAWAALCAANEKVSQFPESKILVLVTALSSNLFSLDEYIKQDLASQFQLFKERMSIDSFAIF